MTKRLLGQNARCQFGLLSVSNQEIAQLSNVLPRRRDVCRKLPIVTNYSLCRRRGGSSLSKREHFCFSKTTINLNCTQLQSGDFCSHSPCSIRQWDHFMRAHLRNYKTSFYFSSEKLLCTAISCMHIEKKLLLPPRAHADQSVSFWWKPKNYDAELIFLQLAQFFFAQKSLYAFPSSCCAFFLCLFMKNDLFEKDQFTVVSLWPKSFFFLLLTKDLHLFDLILLCY